jgi:hypothetical protein
VSAAHENPARAMCKVLEGKGWLTWAEALKLLPPGASESTHKKRRNVARRSGWMDMQDTIPARFRVVAGWAKMPAVNVTVKHVHTRYTAEDVLAGAKLLFDGLKGVGWQSRTQMLERFGADLPCPNSLVVYTEKARELGLLVCYSGMGTCRMDERHMGKSTTPRAIRRAAERMRMLDARVKPTAAPLKEFPVYAPDEEALANRGGVDFSVVPERQARWRYAVRTEQRVIGGRTVPVTVAGMVAV